MHPLDRLHQQETYNKIINSKSKFIICRAPTGFGKSALAGQAAFEGHKTLVCVSTKSLQQQYAGSYGFFPLYGKGNYSCLDLNAKEFLTADVCTISKQSYMDYCLNTCPYPHDKQEFVAASGGCLNYHKFLADDPVVAAFDAEYLFLDEAHELKRVVINHSGIDLSWSGYLKDYIEPVVIDLPQPLAIRRGREFLETLSNNLKSRKPQHPSKGGKKGLWKWHEQVSRNVDTTLLQMDTASDCWFIHSDDSHFVCKPLTARFHFDRLFDKAEKIVLMSATIKPRNTRALGITDYEFIPVPNTIPAIMRPIYDMRGPNITAGSSLRERKQHAKLIAKPFLEYQDWNGLVHVTSEKMAGELGNMLYDYTQRPVWIGKKGIGTDEAYQSWQEYLGSNHNAIAVTWQFMTGMDGGDLNINITARVPYPNFGDKFESAMFGYNPGDARVDVANLLEQQQGRNRRGHSRHYGGRAEKFNGICDGKWSKLKSAYSGDFLEAVR